MTGFPFPEPTLIVTADALDPNVRAALEGTLIETVEPFGDLTDLRVTFETAVVICRFDDAGLRRELVDWINLEIAPRCRPGRAPIWL
jgi:hypothetical protein